MDRQACLSLLTAAESELRTDFIISVRTRRKDIVSKDFRNIVKNKLNEDQLKISLENDILEVWTLRMPSAKTSISELRGALKYRHWLAHGRYWKAKLGRNYDPQDIHKIITNLFSNINLID